MSTIFVYNINDPRLYADIVLKNQNNANLYPDYTDKLYYDNRTPSINGLFNAFYIKPFIPDSIDIAATTDSTTTTDTTTNTDTSIADQLIEDPLAGYDETTTSKAWGDPHFELNVADNKVQSFDFQGKNDVIYSMLENDDISLNAKFTDAANLNARYISDQNLELKGTGINIVSHSGGKYEIYNNGNLIDKDDPALKQLNISVNYEDSKLTVDYKEKTITQLLNKSNIENQVEVKPTDKGILNQLIGAFDTDNKDDNTTLFTFDVNNDGKIDENDVLHYNSNAQLMVNSKKSGISAPVIFSLNDKADTLAQSFVNSINKNSKNVDESFDGAFDGSGNITNPDDKRLEASLLDSQAVIDAKKAMKANLIYIKSKTDKNKQAAVEATKKWITSSSNSIINSLNTGTGSQASRFSQDSGYSRSQWNEYMGNQFIKTDNFLS